MRQTIAIVLLLAFASLGIAHVIKPDYFIRRSGVLKGGTLLTRVNRFEFRVVGAIFAAGALYVFLQILRK